MGVYIKDMEMPQNCEECDLKVWDEYDDIDYVCPFSGVIVLNIGRQGSCPLVEVPPHGRLIDADALAKDLEYDVELDSRILDDMDFVGKEREHIQFDKDCKQKCMRYLTEAPTVIPATAAKEGE